MRIHRYLLALLGILSQRKVSQVREIVASNLVSTYGGRAILSVCFLAHESGKTIKLHPRSGLYQFQREVESRGPNNYCRHRYRDPETDPSHRRRLFPIYEKIGSVQCR